MWALCSSSTCRSFNTLPLSSSIRPMSKSEITNGDADVVVYPEENALSMTNQKNQTKGWEFDKVFGPVSTQEEVFEEAKVGEGFRCSPLSLAPFPHLI